MFCRLHLYTYLHMLVKALPFFREPSLDFKTVCNHLKWKMIVGILLRLAKQCLATPKRSQSEIFLKTADDVGRIIEYEQPGVP